MSCLLSTHLSFMVGSAFPDLATRWGRPHRASDLCNRFLPGYKSPEKTASLEAQEAAGRRMKPFARDLDSGWPSL